jgi:hypothetical protein
VADKKKGDAHDLAISENATTEAMEIAHFQRNESDTFLHS